MNRYYNPVQTVEGPGCAGELAALLREMALEEGRVLLLVWNEDVLKLPTFMELADAGFMVCSLVFRASNPTVEQLFETYQATRDFVPEVVVAVGGGSILDVGKSLCCLYGTDLPDADSLRRLIEEKSYGHPAARWIGVPTTAGTGSEVTCWATIWDPERDAKRSVECRENYAFAALVDPELAADIDRLVLSHPNILGIHDLVYHDYGPGRAMMSFHAEVPADTDLLEMHDIIDHIERELKAKHHIETVIHTDPVVNDERTNALREQVEAAARALDPVLSIHDLRITAGPYHTNVLFDVMVPYGFRLTDAQVTRELRQAVEALSEKYSAVIQVDHSYVERREDV